MKSSRDTNTLIALTVLPLVVIGLQIAVGATGGVANGFYKVFFIIPPVLYCRARGIRISEEIFCWQNWRNDLRLSLVLGVVAAVVFLALYYTIGGMLVDKEAIAAKIHTQFGVTAGTVLLIAPFTIVINSLVEEFFYRGFAFGQLAARRPVIGTLLPAAVFTVQHLMFTFHWVTALPLAIGIVALFIFALVAQAMYAKADSIVAPWVIHICGDLAMMAIAVELVL